ncbi:MAG: signal peptidase I [Chloroflexota bacterium]
MSDDVNLPQPGAAAAAGPDSGADEAPVADLKREAALATPAEPGAGQPTDGQPIDSQTVDGQSIDGRPAGDLLPGPEPTARLREFLVEVLQTAVLALVLFLAIDFATARIRVQSISMQPTLYEHDFVLVNKLAYRWGDIERTDIIVFNPPISAAPEPYIKRVIGLPGDVVRIVGGNVYVNDELLHENYLAAEPGYNGIWNVPEGSVFVLGDNRNNSSDSHQWGMVPIENIIGKALVIYWPVDHWDVLHEATATAAAP